MYLNGRYVLKTVSFGGFRWYSHLTDPKSTSEHPSCFNELLQHVNSTNPRKSVPFNKK